MGYNIRIAQSAHKELVNAVEYITMELASPFAVKKMLDEYDVALEALKTNPFAYPINHEVSAEVGFEVRRIRVRNYRIYYRILDHIHTVQIISFLHVQQDLPRHICRDLEQ